MHIKRTLLTASLLFIYTFAFAYPSAWQANTSYDKGDLVIWDGVSYIAIADVPNTLSSTPDSSSNYWADLLSTAPGNESSDPPSSEPSTELDTENLVNFRHGFKHLDQSGASDYLIEQPGIKKYSEWQNPPVTYYGPSANDQLSTLTYKYSFDGSVSQAKVRISLSVWNFNVSGAYGSGTGEASAWASKDGSNWVNLIDLPTPTTSFSDGKTFEDMLPSSVLGASNLYLQIRMKVSGAPNSSYTTAQFGRSDANANKDIFYLDANYSANSQVTEIISFDNIENPEEAFELTGGASLKFGDPLVDQTSSFRIQANKNDHWQDKSIATFKQSFDLSDFEMNFNMHFYDSYSAGGGDFLWVSLVNPTDEDISVHIAFYSWYTGQSSNAARVILRKSTNGTFEEVWANDVKSLLGINTFSKVGLTHSPYAVNILYNSGVLSLKINDLSVFTQEIDLNDLGVLDSEGKAKIAFRGHTGAAREFHDVSNWTLTLNKSSNDSDNKVSPWFVQTNKSSLTDIHAPSDEEFIIAGGLYASSYDSSSNELWSFSSANGGISALSSDQAGNLYLSGHISSDQNWGGIAISHNYETDPFVGKMNSSGDWQWVRPISTSAWSSAHDICTDDDGNTYITGYVYSTPKVGNDTVGGKGWYDAFLAKIDKDGNWQWAVSAGSGSGDFGFAVTLDSTGNVYWAGDFRNTVSFGSTTLTSRGGGDVNGGGEIFIAKLDSSGNFLWAKRAGSANENSLRERPTNLVTDAQDNVYLSGYISGDSDFGDLSVDSRGGQDGFLAKLNPSGDWQWVRIVGGSGDESISALEYLNDNTLVVAGSFSNNITLSNGTALSPSANSDSYILTYNTSGELLDFDTLNNSGSINISSSTVNSDGNIIFGGTFTGDFNYANQTHQSANSGADKSVFALFYPLQGETIDLTSGLVAWYPFDGNASDMSGNGNDGTVYGASLGVDRNGEAGKAYEFDGVDDYIEVNYSSSVNTESFTISLWANPYILDGPANAAEGHYMSPITSRDDFPTRGFLMYKTPSGKWSMGVGNGNYSGWQGLVTQDDAVAKDWTHLAFTFASNYLTGYTKGIPFQSIEATLSSNTSRPLRIGAGTTESLSPKFYFNGSIDDVRIYNRALSEAEVQALYELEKPTIDLTSGLVAWYPFDGNASDMSGNGNDGTVYGATLGEDRNGEAGKAYQFDGDDDYIKVPHNNKINFNVSDSFTISLWSLIPTPEKERSSIFEKWSSIGSYPFNLRIGPDLLSLGFGNWDGSNSKGASASLGGEETNFIHISCINRAGKFSISINGSKKSVNYSTWGDSINHLNNTLNTSDLYFGRRGGTSDFNFKGSIDDVRIYNRALSEAEVQALYELEKPKIDLTSGLVAWYTFDGNASDMSGNGNDGTVYGATLGEDRNGEVGKAYEFDGVDDYIEVLHDPLIDFDVSEPHTLSLWIKLENDSPSGAILGKWSNSYDPYPYCLRFSSDNFGISANIYTGGYPQNSSNALGTGYVTIPEQINEHIQICAVFYPDLLELYTQGKLLVSRKSELISDFSSNTHSLFIGKWGGRSDRNFKGTIDDVRIYNRALSEAEVQALYELEKPKIDLTSGLVAWYPFDGNASDMSGNGNDGTVVNGTLLTDDRNGEPNKAYKFDGVDDGIDLPALWAVGSGELSVSLWFKPNGVITDWMYLTSNKSDFYSNFFRTGFDQSGKLRLYTEEDGGSLAQFTSSYAYDYRKWNKVVFTRKGSVGKIFVNDQPEETKIGTTKSGNLGRQGDNWYFGYDGNYAGTNGFFKGSIDDIRIYNRALSEAEVQALYELEKPKFNMAECMEHLPTGSLIAIPAGTSAPSGLSLIQQANLDSFDWVERAPVSVTDFAYDGVSVLGTGIYFLFGGDYSNTPELRSTNLFEKYDPVTDTWESLTPSPISRSAVASASTGGKFYAIGGTGLSSVGVYDLETDSWSEGVSLPSEVNHATAIAVNGRIYLIGGKNSSGQHLAQVLCFDPSTQEWTVKEPMPTARRGAKLVWFMDKIWVIGGRLEGHASTSKVESYDPVLDAWQTEASLTSLRGWPVAWVANGKIFVGGGLTAATDDWNSLTSSFEAYDPQTKQWSVVGNIPENKYAGDAVVLDDSVYLIAGQRGPNDYSDKVFSANLKKFDLYQVTGGVPISNSVGSGASEVIKNPSKYGLFTQEDINSTRDTAKKEGEDIGKSLGEYSVINNPTGYGLVSNENHLSILAETNASARSVGAEEGRSEVINNPTGYGLVSSENHLSILAETNASARSVGAEEGRNEILADPYSYNLVTKLEYDQMVESLRMPDTNATPYTDGWFYIPDRGWMWAITQTYPWFYDANTSNWVYFKQGGALPRYYNYSTKKWMEWPDFVKKPWDTHYEQWLKNPEPYGGANVLGIIKSAKDERKTKLDLGDYHVKDLAPLSGLKHLTALNIGDNDITDISVLSQMDGLTRLVLKDNKNLVDLHPLADLSNLEELDLMYNDLSQLDLTPLYQLSNLRILRVSDYLVSFSQMNALQEKLPNCQILFVEAEDFDWDN